MVLYEIFEIFNGRLLSKPKEKHKKIRDKIDFKKIVHNGVLIGVLNFNLMIPVENAQIMFFIKNIFQERILPLENNV